MKICMYGFSGQNMNLWLKYFRDHTSHEITLFTPSFAPSRDYDFPRLSVTEIEKKGNRVASSLFSRYIRKKTAWFLRRNRFDLVIMQGLYNRSFAPFLFLRAKADRKVITVWNDLNHRRISRERKQPETAAIIQALSAADLILPTWKPTRDAFAEEFPELAGKMAVKSWGTDIEMLPEETGKPPIPEKFREAAEAGLPILFWPRTLRVGIRHDLLLEALQILGDRQVKLVSILPMGRAGTGAWDRKVLTLLEKAGEKSFVAADHSGHIPLGELRGLYGRADLMVNLADSDQVSTCVAEAFLFELDVILSDIPPYRALKEMGFSVKLVPHDPETIADAIEETVARADSEASRERRRKNREAAEKLFDLKTNLDSLIGFAQEAPTARKRNLLFLAPESPPFGGVADQSALLCRSRSFSMGFNITPVRTNPRRNTEDPSRRGRGSMKHFMELLIDAAFRSRLPEPEAIQLVANGDVSFIRDMLVASVIRSRHRIPLSVHLHGSRKGFWHDRSSGSSAFENEARITVKGRIGYSLCRMLLKRADSLTQLTRGIDDFYRSIGFPEADCVIPNGTAEGMENFSPGVPGSMLFVGRLSREKGFHDLLEALRYLETTEWRLDVLGDYPSGDQRTAVEKLLLAHPHGSRIHIHGPVTGGEKWEFFKNASVLVLPTHVDVFPVVLLEGMAFGCAIVTTRTGEITEISGSENFDFADPGDSRALGRILDELLADHEGCSEKGMLNHRASANYTIEKAAELMRGNIERLLLQGDGNG